MVEILRGNVELLEGFNAFLTDGSRIEVSNITADVIVVDLKLASGEVIQSVHNLSNQAPLVWTTVASISEVQGP